MQKAFTVDTETILFYFFNRFDGVKNVQWEVKAHDFQSRLKSQRHMSAIKYIHRGYKYSVEILTSLSIGLYKYVWLMGCGNANFDYNNANYDYKSVGAFIIVIRDNETNQIERQFHLKYSGHIAKVLQRKTKLYNQFNSIVTECIDYIQQPIQMELAMG